MFGACGMTLFLHTSPMFQLHNAASHVTLRAGDMTAQTSIELTDCPPLPPEVFWSESLPVKEEMGGGPCPLWTYADGGKQVSPWMTLLLLTGQSYTVTAIVSVFVTAEGICPEASSGLQWVIAPHPPHATPTPTFSFFHFTKDKQEQMKTAAWR